MLDSECEACLQQFCLMQCYQVQPLKEMIMNYCSIKTTRKMQKHALSYTFQSSTDHTIRILGQSLEC